jgi:hypothetical protein
MGVKKSDSALFVLIESEVGITKNQALKIELNKLKPRTIFGERPLINNSTRLTNVMARGKVTLLRLDAGRFKVLNPAIINKFQLELNKLLVLSLNTKNDHLAEIQMGIDNSIRIYIKVMAKRWRKILLTSDEFKMVQKLWSAYFVDFRTKLKLTAAKLTNHKTHIKVSPTIPVQVLWQR